MTRDEFSKLNLYDFVERNDELYVYLGEYDSYFTARSEHDYCECSKLQLLKEFTISSVEEKDNGFYEYKGTLSQVSFDYETVSMLLIQNKKEFHLPISKQTLQYLQTTPTTKEINSILNFSRRERPAS